MKLELIFLVVIYTTVAAAKEIDPMPCVEDTQSVKKGLKP